MTDVNGRYSDRLEPHSRQCYECGLSHVGTLNWLRCPGPVPVPAAQEPKVDYSESLVGPVRDHMWAEDIWAEDLD